MPDITKLVWTAVIRENNSLEFHCRERGFELIVPKKFESTEEAIEYSTAVHLHMQENGGKFPNFCSDEWK